MPIFEYHCERCGHRFDVLQKAGAAAPDACPECGAAAPAKCLSAPSFQLSGKGWRKPTAASQQAARKPPRRVGHMLDSGAPHSHDDPPRNQRSSQVQPPAPAGHSHSGPHDHGHGHPHKH